MFSKWDINKTGLMIVGFFTMLGAVLILFPQTFVWGNFITAAGILLIMAFHANNRDLKGFLIELHFFLLSFVILYLHHPLTRS